MNGRNKEKSKIFIENHCWLNQLLQSQHPFKKKYRWGANFWKGHKVDTLQRWENSNLGNKNKKVKKQTNQT